jgi:hypothetical protein
MTEKGLITKQILIDTADAIRLMRNTQRKFRPAEMAEAIGDIQVSEGDDDMSVEFIEGTLTDLDVDDVTIINNERPFTGLENSLETVKLDNVTTASNNVLKNFKALKSVSFENLLNVPHYFCYNCTSLNSINFSNAETIGVGAFYKCNLTGTITFPKIKTIDCSYSSNSGAFCLTTMTKFVAPELTTIVQGADDDYEGAFEYCSQLVEVDTPKLSFAGGLAFRHCVNLEKITANLETINGSVFFDCQKLHDIDLSKVKAIGNWGLGQTYALKSANCPELTSLGIHAFVSSAIESVYMPKLKTIAYGAFYNSALKGDVEFPELVSIEHTYTGNSGCFYNTKITKFTAPKLTTITGSNPDDDREGIFEHCTELVEVDAPSLKTSFRLFVDCTKLEKVNCPFETIGNYNFFRCSSLYDVNFSECKTINYQAFYNCTSLTTVNAPKLVTINDSAFQNSGVQSISAPLCTTINKRAFVNTPLTGTIEFPELTTINMGGWSGEYGAFQNTKSLTKFIAPKLKTISNYTGSYYTEIGTFQDSSIEEINAPLLESIGSTSFRNCTNLTKVIGNSLTYIGNYAFSGCTSLTDIDLTNVTDIGIYAFQNCTSLPELDAQNVVNIYGSSFSGCSSLASLNIPNCEFISDCAFANTGLIGTITLPKVTAIRTQNNTYGAFYNTKITKLVAPELVTLQNGADGWNEGAFSTCTSLEEVDAPKLENLCWYAFYGCTNLTDVNIPNAVTIGLYAFKNCTNLTSINIPLLTQIEVGTFSQSGLSGILSLPEVTLIKGDTSNEGAFYKTNITSLNAPELITIQDGPNANAKGAFDACSQLTSINVPKLETLGSYAFCDCPLLNVDSDTFPEVTFIGAYALGNNSIITSLTFPKVTTIGQNALRTLDSLTSLSAPLATAVGNWALFGNQNLRTVSLPNATSIGAGAFQNCTQLTSISLPECLTIKHAAFLGTNLTGVISFPKVQIIYSCAYSWSDTDRYGTFRGNTYITEVNLPECQHLSFPNNEGPASNTNVGVKGTFSACTGITSVNIPKIETIGYYTFNGCTGLTSIDIPSSCTSIANNAFNGCTNLETINIHKAENAITGAPWGAPNATINWLGED